MKTKQKCRRRQHWIDSEFQGRFLTTIMKLVILTMSVSIIIPLLLGYIMSLPYSSTAVDWKLTTLCFSIVAIIACLGLAYLSVRISHRICGPIYRIKKSLEAVQQGECPDRIVLRKGDELQDLAELFNEVLEKLYQSKSRLKKVGGPADYRVHNQILEDTVRLEEAKVS